jgi:DHA1 family multidrug resistance protein-like MFS transporter
MDQGVTMGLSNSFMSLGRIFGPLFAGFLFDQNLNFPYIGGALVMFIGFLFSLVWVTQEPNKESGVSLAGLTE